MMDEPPCLADPDRRTGRSRRARLDLVQPSSAVSSRSDATTAATLRDVARAEHAELLVAADNGTLLGTVTFVPDGGPLGEICHARRRPSSACWPSIRPPRAAASAPRSSRRVIDRSGAARRGIVCSSLPEMRAAHRIYERAGFPRAPERDWSPVPGVELIAFAQPFGTR